MNEASDKNPGILASLRRILATLLAGAQNRIELFVVELQEEKCRFVEILICLAALVALSMMTLMLITLTIVILFWDSYRLTSLCVLTGFYLVGAILAWRAMRTRLNSGAAFADTLEELRKDQACLRTGK